METITKNLIHTFIGLVILSLTACTPSNAGIPVTGNSPTPAPTTDLADTQTRTPVSTPIPTLVNPTATPENISIPEGIEFAPGATSATVSGRVEASASKKYVLHASGGQTLSVNLSFTKGAAILDVWGEDGQVLLTNHAEVSSFQGVLPSTQDYHLQVEGRPDGETAYSMTITISPLTLDPTRIKFAPGTTSTTLTANLAASSSKQYIIHALAGQTMNIDLIFTEGSAILVVWGADGNVLLSDHAEVSNFQRTLPTTQDYYIQVKGRAEGSTTYSITVTIPPLP